MKYDFVLHGEYEIKSMCEFLKSHHIRYNRSIPSKDFDIRNQDYKCHFMVDLPSNDYLQPLTDKLNELMFYGIEGIL